MSARGEQQHTPRYPSGVVSCAARVGQLIQDGVKREEIHFSQEEQDLLRKYKLL
jgi:hypothetical protein